MRIHQSNRRSKRSGQALLEMAVVVTVLLLLSMGLIQYAFIANARLTMTNLAREGARYAAVHGSTTGSDAEIKDFVVKSAASTPLHTITAADVTISPAEGSTMPVERRTGNLITVTVKYDMRQKFFLPFLTSASPDSPPPFPGLAAFGPNSSASSNAIME